MADSNENRQEIRKKVEEELELYFRLPDKKAKFVNILTDMTDGRQHYPFMIDHVELIAECTLGCKEMMFFPDAFFEIADGVANAVMTFHYESRDSGTIMSKKKIHCRIYNFVEMHGHITYIFPGCEECERFGGFIGIVTKVKKKMIAEKSREYKCSSCQFSTFLPGKMSRGYFYEKWHNSYNYCPNACARGRLQMVETRSITVQDLARIVDYQEITIRECESSISEAGSSQPPKSMVVILEYDLTEKCIPGDNVFVIGKLFVKSKEFKPGHEIKNEYAVYANNVQIQNDANAASLLTFNKIQQFRNFWAKYRQNVFAGRNIIVASICPTIHEEYLVKLAVAVFLARGIDRTFKKEGDVDEGVRANLHLLLVGDPGIAKSKFLVLAKKLIPRSQYVVGQGTSRAGLTVAIQMKQGGWEMDAGSVVLANGSLCAIDELSTLSTEAQDSLHEVMEQQTLTIAKAQTNTTLHTNCCIMAAMNPPQKTQGRSSSDNIYNYDYENLNIKPSLLSRFDLILYLKDLPNLEWDSEMADAILMPKKNTAEETALLWKENDLSAYFLYIKRLRPKMTEDALQIIQAYFRKVRACPQRTDLERRTPRLLESLQRVATCHARLLMRETVEIFDAVTAVTLVDRSILQHPLFAEAVNTLHVKFPKDAKDAYGEEAFNVLHALDLPDLWQKESGYLESCLTTKDNEPVNEPERTSEDAAYSFEQDDELDEYMRGVDISKNDDNNDD